jgi:L-asparagine oxygenase
MRTLTLPPDVRLALTSAFTECGRLESDAEPFLASVFSAVRWLPADILREILPFRSVPAAPGVLLLRGMPVDDELPPTPSVGGVSAKSTCISEASILLVGLLLGEPVGYADEMDGVLVQNVYPTEAEKKSPSNDSSETDLGFHTELAFSSEAPDRPMHLGSPDFLLLLGLRAAPQDDAVTTLVEALDICAELTAGALRTLRQPLFELQAPYSFTRVTGHRPWSPPVPLLHGDEQATTLAFDLACGARGICPDATVALNELRSVVARPELHVRIRIAAGDLLLVNNRTCAHARSRFRAAFDGTDRWLQRVYVRRDLQGLAHASGRSFRVL